jgi:tripartite-type tricarboxylate transporter receptor subunit TctC
MKRCLFLLFGTCIVATVFAGGGAQSSGSSAGYPNRPIEIFFPANPGTATDTTLRIIVPYLEKYLGVPVMAVSDGGAAGSIALNRVAHAKPDGYTWGYWTIVHVANTCLGDILKGQIDPVSDYVWAGGNYRDQITVVTRKNGPLKTMDDIVNNAKANPGKVIFVRSAPGDISSLAINYLEKSKGIKFNILSGLDGGESMAAIMGGHADVYMDNFSSSNQLYLDGSIEVAGIGGTERVPEMPNVATFNEQGYEGWPVHTSERHFYGPSKIPQEIVDIFRDALKKAAADPEYIESCKRVNLRPYYADADESLRQIRRYADAF